MLVGCLLGTVDKSLLSGLTDFVRSWEEIFDFPFHESNPYNFLMVVVQQHFIEVYPEFAN